jgi:hypothetical protein
MSDPSSDPLWAEFCALRAEMLAEGLDILLAGGYALFLKQRWVQSQPDVPVVVAPASWLDVAPRVTKDLDLVVSLDVLASADAQGSLTSLLKRRGFEVSEKNPRWQFAKSMSDGKQLLVEFHARRPTSTHPNLHDDDRRVKHQPSLGLEGVHGRTNPESIGCELHPFVFEIDDVKVAIPNAVTLAMMKLTAMRDRWNRSRDERRDARTREFDREQAAKHAQDVCRAVAMVTREERDMAIDVVQTLRNEPEFRAAATIFREALGDEESWATAFVQDKWSAADLDVIRQVLDSWFGEVL